MRFTTLFAALLGLFLSASALALPSSPEIDNILESLAHDEIHVFSKRDSVLTPRDIQFARQHNVDINTMYKHSIIKRDDGDHVTLWVANNYDEEEDDDHHDQPLSKRQRMNIWAQEKYSETADKDVTICNAGGYWNAPGALWHVGDTGPNAPFTGGANAIINWGLNASRGRWKFTKDDPDGQRNLIVAGSNSGFNMRFTVEVKSLKGTSRIGCRDVGRTVQRARDAFQRNVNGGWRVRAYGEFTCVLSDLTTCHNSWCDHLPGTQGWNWWIDNSSRTVQ